LEPAAKNLLGFLAIPIGDRVKGKKYYAALLIVVMDKASVGNSPDTRESHNKPRRQWILI